MGDDVRDEHLSCQDEHDRPREESQDEQQSADELEHAGHADS